MELTITDLEPKNVWKHFYSITQIPRPSGHELAIIQHIIKFARDNNLEYKTDETGNLVVKKPANTSRLGAKKIVLQSHVDMVPQKNSDKQHDFLKDAIETIIDGGWVRANNTTLGADNGLGVAAILAVLESDEIEHGPIEGLFTVSEETGMDGAFGLQPGFIDSEILLNLDTEDDDELIIGCAGGLEANITWDYDIERIDSGNSFRIVLRGLKGGHSGIDINLGRGNANKTLIRLILFLQDNLNIRLSSLIGGNLRNAIPRESSVVVVVGDKDVEKIGASVKRFEESIRNEFNGIETSIEILVESVDPVHEVMSAGDQQKALDVLSKCPNGVIRMSSVMPDIVQTSTNLSVMKLGKGKAESLFLLRSSDDEDKKQLAIQIENAFTRVGAKAVFQGAYPGWNPNENSYVLQQAKNTYITKFGKEPDVKVVHAGLECGIIVGTFPQLDMVSFGPTIKHPHSPDEKVNIASVVKFWVYLKSILETL